MRDAPGVSAPFGPDFPCAFAGDGERSVADRCREAHMCCCTVQPYFGGSGLGPILANADRWKFVNKLRLIRVEYRQKASGAKNQGFSTCC
jgi:hypothetical protein